MRWNVPTEIGRPLTVASVSVEAAPAPPCFRKLGTYSRMNVTTTMPRLHLSQDLCCRMRSSIVTSLTLPDQIPKKQLCHEVEIVVRRRGRTSPSAATLDRRAAADFKTVPVASFRSSFARAERISDRICVL